MKKIIFGFAVCMALLSFESNAKENLSLKQEFKFDSEEIESNDKADFLEQINEIIKCLTEIKNMLLNFGKITVENSELKNENFIEFKEPSNSGQIKDEKILLNNKEFAEFEKELRGLNDALLNPEERSNKKSRTSNKKKQNPGISFDTILNKGSKIFDNKKNEQLFNSENTPSDWKNLYFNALNAWKEIKGMLTSDKKFVEKLNNFKEKIRLLHQDIQNSST